MKRIGSCVGLLLLVFASFSALGQNYSSVQDGNWDDVNTWDGGVIPDAVNSDVITIGNTVTIPNGFSVTVDGVNVNAGGSLILSSGGILDVSPGSSQGDGITVQGDLYAAQGSSITGTDGVNVFFDAGSFYHHQFTSSQGVIPLAVWDVSATTSIEGYTNFNSATGAGNWSQDFGNLTWNCSSANTLCNLNGLLISTTGNLTISSTGSGTVQFSQAENPHIIIGGDLTISGTSKVNFSTIGTNTLVDVTGDFVYTSTNSTGTSTNTTGACTLTVTGSFFMDATGGTLNFSKGTDGVGTMKLSGDFTLNNGTITESGANSVGVSHGFFDFVGNGTQQFTNNATITNTFYYTIESTSTLDVVGESPLRASTGGIFNLYGTIRVASTNGTGAIVTGTSLGNIRTSTRNFFSGAKIVYSGTTQQVVGNGHPSTSGVDMEVANPGGVVLNNTLSTGSGLSNLNIGGNLYLTSGDLTVDTQSRSTTRTLTINGTITPGTNHIVFLGANSDLVVAGSGAFGVFPFSAAAQPIQNFTFNRTSSSISFSPALTITATAAINAGAVTFNGATTTVRTLTLAANTSVDFNGTGSVTGHSTLGSLTLNSGSILYFDGQSMSVANLTTNPTLTGSFYGNSSSSLTLTGSKGFGTVQFAAGGNTVGTLTLNIPASGAPDITIASTLNVSSTLNLTNGTFYNSSGLTMGSGSTINRVGNVGSFSSSPASAIPAGGPYNLNYTGNSLTTGVEGQGSVTNLTCNLTTGQTLTGGTALVISNAFLISQGTFSATSSPTISAATFTNNGTYRGQASNFSLTGNFTNNGTFNANTSTFTFAGTTNVLGSTTATFNNVVISGILNGSSDFGLLGSFTNNGTFNAGSGTVTFSGTATQSIQGTTVTTFNNITDTNTSATVQVQSSQKLKGVLTLTGNPTTFDADGSANTSVFTLLSTGDNPTADASIATLGTGATVTGKVTVQRFMSIEGASTGRIYRYISSPVQNAAASDIQAEIPVTGTFTGNNNLTCSGCTAGSTQSMFAYSEPVAGVFDNGYVNFPSASNTETFQPGVGYTIYVRGNILASALWDLSGVPNQGSVTLPVSYTTTSGGVSNDGWNFVGNPYPSTIDWNSGGWTKAGLDGTIYIRDNGQTTPVYATYNGITGTNGGSRYISTGQGFWVKATSAPTLTATETVKVAGTQTTFIRQATPSNLLRITMKNNVNRDEAVIHFREDATSGFDANADAWKLPNANFNLSSELSTGDRLAINSLPTLDCNSITKLNVTAAAGSYKLEFSQLETFATGVQLTLYDKFTGSTIDMRSGLAYNFNVTSDANSYGSNRFTVAVSTPAIQDVALSTVPVCTGSDAQVTLQNTQSGVSYQLYDGSDTAISEKVVGDGNSVSLRVLGSVLANGVNNIVLKESVTGCSTMKLVNTAVTVNALKTVTSTTPDKHCQAGSLTLKAGGAGLHDHYNWYAHSADTEPVLADSTGTYVTPVLQESTTFYVSVTTAAGCESSKVPVTATVVQYDAAKIDVNTGNVLHSNHGAGNQWYFNDAVIIGATGQDLAVAKSGKYSVVVNVDGCSTTDQLNYIVTGVADDIQQLVSVYPNPTSTDIQIRYSKSVGVETVKIFSNLGVEIGEIKTVEEGDNRIGKYEMSHLASGLYIIRINKAGKMFNIKVSKK